MPGMDLNALTSFGSGMMFAQPPPQHAPASLLSAAAGLAPLAPLLLLLLCLTLGGTITRGANPL